MKRTLPLLVLGFLFLVGCGGNVNTTPTAVPPTVTYTPLPATSTPLPPPTSTPMPTDTPTPIPSNTPTNTPIPTSSPTTIPTPVAQLGDVETLFAYMPQILIMDQLDYPFWNTTYYVDVAQIRQALNLPDVLETPQQKRILSTKLELYAQGLFPRLFFYDLFSQVDSADTWGWDMTNVGQLLLSSYYQVAVLQGDFATEKIHDRLLDQAYTDTPFADFLIYTSPYNRMKFAVKRDMLLITANPDDNIAILIEYANTQPNAVEHPTMQAILEQVNQSWGLVLMPNSTNFIDSEFIDRLPENIREPLEAQYGPDLTVSSLSWDLMGIGFAGIEQSTLTFAYHYPSAQIANEHLEIVQASLTEGTMFEGRDNRQWQDIMTLKSIQVQNETVVAVLDTVNPYLIGRALNDYEYFLLAK